MGSSLAIIDYGMGNLHSVAKAVEKVAPATRIMVTDDEKLIRSADRIIFPGVGAIRDCMAEIKKRNLDVLIKDLCQQKPLLAVCVGMQALMTESEENGGVSCLNILPGKVKLFNGAPFKGEQKLKVPHMGWNRVEQKIKHPLWKGIEQNERCYFVHSYYVEAENSLQIAAQTEYGFKFCSALSQNNIFAVQFHPEKSHRAGLRLLENFSSWNGQGS
jgi:imidazole glycerol-phosphate synthase subunit HisH